MKPHFWRPPVLTTERLELRPFVAGDAEALFEYAKNPNVTRFTLWDAHQTVADTVQFVSDYAVLRYMEGVPEPYAITLKPAPQPVGSCGCFWAAEPHRTMELGYWIGEPFWGKGYVVEACRAVLLLAFAEYGPERMQARVIDGNAASERVLVKLGFRYEGTLRRSLLRRGTFEGVRMYSLTRGEWMSQSTTATPPL